MPCILSLIENPNQGRMNLHMKEMGTGFSEYTFFKAPATFIIGKQ